MIQISAQRVRQRLKTATFALVAITAFGTAAMAATPANAAPRAIETIAGGRKVDGLAPIAGEALSELHTYSVSQSAEDLAEYESTRNALAKAIAERLGIDPIRMQKAWHSADLKHQTALLAALTQLGTPYRRNSLKPGVGFDCSGLTTFAWSIAGVTITRQSGSQIRAASPRTPETAQAGDLMYYPGHAMMYLGVDRAMVHAPYSGRTVEVDNLSTRRGFKLGDPTI